VWPQSGVVLVEVVDVVEGLVAVVVVVGVGSLVGSGLLSPWHLSGSLHGLVPHWTFSGKSHQSFDCFHSNPSTFPVPGLSFVPHE